MKYIESSKLYTSEGLHPDQIDIRDKALNDLKAFIALAAPHQVMSDAHKELCDWMMDNDDEFKLVLWPRDHGKSRICAFYGSWRIVRNPAIAIIYLSATSGKAEEQLRFIKTILDNKTMAKYFPGLLHPVAAKRSAWNNTEIIVDHPERGVHGKVDNTLTAVGLTTTVTGKHADLIIADDAVSSENNNDRGRKLLREKFSYLGSVLAGDGTILGVGTRYHPKDLYDTIMNTEVEEYNEAGEEEGDTYKLYKLHQREVEKDGEFLWPRKQEGDGRRFGFDVKILSRKRAMYNNIRDFYAQYYNSPNEDSTNTMERDLFQYYKRAEMATDSGDWYLADGSSLTLYCAFDPAFSVGDRADYSAITVGGVASDGRIFNLHNERFKTDKISEMLRRLQSVYDKFRFRRLRIEAVAGQKAIAQHLADQMKSSGIYVPIDFFRPERMAKDSSDDRSNKRIRIMNTLEPLYRAGKIWHYRGGLTSSLEDEIVLNSPPHDDLADSWFMCVDSMPKVSRQKKNRIVNTIHYQSRFGGVA